MMNKRGFEFSFGWLFALIAGAAILALVIYGTTSFIGTSKKIEDSSRSLELSSLLRQLETGVEEQGVSVVDTSVETRITNDCFATGSTAAEKAFGTQSIRTATSSRIGKSFQDNGVPLRSNSIYLFSNKTITGDSFVTISQSFSFPFKIADIVVMWSSSERYCFVNAPKDIQDRTEALNIPGVNFTTSNVGCMSASKKICFAANGCDIEISTISKSVSKKGIITYYDDESSALFYAAIFSDKDIYECQLKRLAGRGVVLSTIYSDKASIGSNYGCSAGSLVSALSTLSANLNNTRTSIDIKQAKQAANIVEGANDALACRQF